MNEIASDFQHFNRYIQPSRRAVEKKVEQHIVLPPDDVSQKPVKKVVNSAPVDKVKKDVKKQPSSTVRHNTPIPSDATPEGPTLAVQTNLKTLEDIAAMVAAPMKVVRNNGKIENIDSGIKVECPRGHIHNYLLADIMKVSPTCITCSRGGVIAKRIRTQLEELFSTPFTYQVGDKKYSHFTATITASAEGAPIEMRRPCIVNLFIVKSGHDVPRTGFCIVLPESQSRVFINDCIYKQCRGYDFGPLQPRINALVEVKKSPAKMLPYGPVFASHELKYRILNTEMLYVENCGWGAK